jgi:hypothetical protein
MQVIGRSLGSDGSSMYATVVGDFFLYPSGPEWVCIWEPTVQSHRFNDMVARLPSRRAAVDWIESALSFA